MIWIRCEANSNVGHGHLGRCRALYEELTGRGYPATFACTKESQATFLSYGIEPEIVSLFELPHSGFFKRSRDDFYVVDDYRLKDKFKDVLYIEDDVTRPLIRKEFTRLGKVGTEYKGSSGQRALEALYEGQFLILHCAADNQQKYFSHFISQGVAAPDRFHKGMKDAAIGYAISMKPANKYLASKAIMELRPAESEEVFRLRNRGYIRAVCFNTRRINQLEHENWWDVNGINVSAITAYGKFIGVVSYIKGEISIYLEREYQGLAFGEVVLNSFDRPAKARIKPDNYASIKLFTKCGFIKNGDYYCRD